MAHPFTGFALDAVGISEVERTRFVAVPSPILSGVLELNGVVRAANDFFMGLRREPRIVKPLTDRTPDVGISAPSLVALVVAADQSAKEATMATK